MMSLNVPSFITRLYLGRQFTSYGLLVLQFIKIYSMPGIFHACNYCSSIFWNEVNDVIASSTEVSDDQVAGGGRYFYILVVERHLTEPISCFSSSKSEMFDYNLPWNVEEADDIGQGRLSKQKRIWNKTKFGIVFITMLIISIIVNSKKKKKKQTILITNCGVGDFYFEWFFLDSPIAGAGIFFLTFLLVVPSTPDN